MEKTVSFLETEVELSFFEKLRVALFEPKQILTPEEFKRLGLTYGNDDVQSLTLLRSRVESKSGRRTEDPQGFCNTLQSVLAELSSVNMHGISVWFERLFKRFKDNLDTFVGFLGSIVFYQHLQRPAA